jgi:hypothetical protein
MAGLAGAKDLAVENIESSQQGGGAMSLVVVGLPFRQSGS